MSEIVVEFLRSRGRGVPPPTLVDEVMRAVAQAPQRRMSWFARHVPAAVAVGTAAATVAIAAVALLVMQGTPEVGPSPQVPLPSVSAPEEAEASPTSVSTEVDGIRVGIELSQGRTAFDRTVWATVTIVNLGPDSVYWEAGGCGFAADVVATADRPIPVEPGREWPGEAGLLKRRVAAELPGLPVGFRPQELMDLEGAVECPAISIVGELRSGDTERYVAGWDGNDTRGLPASGGAYTVTATFRYYGRGDAPGPEPVLPGDHKEIGVEIPLLVDTSGADYLSPGEAMDRALADPTFASRLAEAPSSRWLDAGLSFDNGRWTLQLQLIDPESCLSASIDGVSGEVSVGAPTASCSADPTALPSPPSATYVEREGLPFTVIESADADVLFADPDTCTSPAGYTVTYPDSWYTNTAIGEVPACTWFSPVSYDVEDPSRVPDEIAIVVHIFEGGLGQIPEYPRTLHEEVAISGLDGFRAEDTIPSSPPDYAYSYAAWLDDDYLGRKLSGSTSTMHGGEYELNRAVLDRIMASLVLADAEVPRETFEPAPHAQADALFTDTASCRSPQGGYQVEYPASWSTNAAGDPAASDPEAECTHFAPEPMDEGVLPAIVGRRIEGDRGSFEAVIDRQFHTIAGRPAVRVEYRGAAGGGGLQPPEWRQLVWLIQLGEIQETGPNVVFTTSTDDARDYELNMAVLDRMMASLVLLNDR